MSLKDPFGDHSGSQAAINAKLGITDAERGKYGAVAVNSTEPDVTVERGKTVGHHVQAMKALCATLDEDGDDNDRDALARIAAHAHHAMSFYEEQPDEKDESAAHSRRLDHQSGKFID
jgi:hypothetical protein